MSDFDDYLRGELRHLRTEASGLHSDSERAALSSRVIARSRVRRRVRASAISSLALLFVIAGAVTAVSISGAGTDEQPDVTSPAPSGSPSTSPTPHDSDEGRTVYVFFLPEDALWPDDKSEYAPLERPVKDDVGTEGRLRLALAELVKGPTSEERSEGLVSMFSEETAGLVNSVEVVDGRATVDFRDFRQIIPQVSTSHAGVAFTFTLNLTVFQFDGIQQVDYLIEGDCSRFWRSLEAECQIVTKEAWDRAGGINSEGLTDCEGLHVPVFKQEVNTNLNKEDGTLEFDYWDDDAQESRHFKIAYQDSACQDNPETKRLIDHALDTASRSE